MEKTKSKTFGPAILVTAAFIGPGTVVFASSAGAKYGYRLLWAVVFSIMATIILQEMSARLGIVTGHGLSQAIRNSIKNPVLKVIFLGLILAAILVGNAAYQTGNITGAAAGIHSLSHTAKASEASVDDTVQDSTASTSESKEPDRRSTWIVVIAVIALALILSGRTSVLQTALTLLVVFMSAIFLIAALLCRPNLGEIAAGFVPSIPEGSEWFVIGLIGTTVVPYNLFLHASAAAQRWPPIFVKRTDDKERAIRDSRRDTIRSVLIGGFVTAAILVTASAAFHAGPEGPRELGGVGDIAMQLEPAVGQWGKWLFGIGLFAAGLTSAITAPIAAAYAAAGCFGWSEKLSDARLKAVAIGVLGFGAGFALMANSSPKETIILAQVANGLLLPLIAIFLVWMTNQAKLMHRFRNRTGTNVMAICVILIVSLIAVRQFKIVFEKLAETFFPATTLLLS